jgi:eukaryotic-like serine/threonine-protein kinase
VSPAQPPLPRGAPPPSGPRSGAGLPAKLGPYEVLTQIASGGMGTVLLGRAPGPPPELVALKRAHPFLAENPDTKSVMAVEAARLSRLESAHIVKLVGRFQAAGELVLALEYIHGVSLAALLDASARSGQPMPVPVVLRIALDALAGLAAIHEGRDLGRALVHADVNPSNLLVGVDGRSRICDLGLCVPEGTRSAQLRGTAAYAAPEAITGGVVAPGSDVFSMGVILWEALRLRRLFKGATEADTIRRVVDTLAPPLDEGRPDLAALAPVVALALSRDPAGRFLLASDLAGSLGAAAPPASREAVGAAVVGLVGGELQRRIDAASRR